MPKNLTRRLSVAAVGAVTTIVIQRLLTAGWEAVTGKEPPQPGDGNASWGGAVSWAVASGIGIGIARLFAQRLAEKWLIAAADQDPIGSGPPQV